MDRVNRKVDAKIGLALSLFFDVPELANTQMENLEVFIKMLKRLAPINNEERAILEQILDVLGTTCKECLNEQ